MEQKIVVVCAECSSPLDVAVYTPKEGLNGMVYIKVSTCEKCLQKARTSLIDWFRKWYYK